MTALIAQPPDLPPTPTKHPTAAIVGRQRELREFDAALARVIAGDACCLTVVGEPGIGKTALLHELCARARHRRLCTVFVNAGELEEAALPGLGTKALSRPMPGAPTDLETLDRNPLDELMGVLGSLGDPQCSGASGPLVIALDDVQWMDGTALNLIAGILRRPPKRPVLLSLAYRRCRLPRPLADAIASAGRGGWQTELELAPLSEHEANRLIRARVAADRRALVYRESGGNPLYLIELARHQIPRVPSTGNTGPDSWSAPRSLVAELQAELAPLSPDAHAAVQAAALLGDPFEPELLAEVAGLSHADTLIAVDELLEQELVRTGPRSRAFRFRHPIVRRVVAQSTSGSFAMQAHERAAAALERAGAPPEARARHVERFASGGDSTAIKLLTRAGHDRAARDPAAAAHWFAAALRLVPETNRARRLDLIVPLSQVLAAAGQVNESRRRLSEALELEPKDPAVRARIVMLLVRAERWLGDPDAARARLSDAVAAGVDEESAAGCALEIELAIDYWQASAWDRMVQASERALGRARLLDSRQQEAEATALKALGECYLARASRAQPAVATVAALVRRLPDSGLAGCLRTLLFAGQAAYAVERHDDAVRLLRRGLAISRSTGQELWTAPLTTTLARAELSRGRLSAAMELSDEATERATLLANEQLLAWSHSVRCLVLVSRGHLEAAIRSGERACVALSRAPGSAMGWLPHCCLGTAMIEGGEPQHGVAMILGNAGGAGLARVAPGFRSHWYTMLARADLSEGSQERSADWLRRADALLKNFPLRGRVAELRRGQAELRLAGGQARTAALSAEAAVEAFRAQRQPVDAGRALTIAGRANAQSGRQEEGRRMLLEAREVLFSCGADEFARRADRALDALESDSDAGLLCRLSARELQVAELVASGVTNRQIAAELVITVKTVERHLSHIFAKLDLRSRAALAASVERARWNPLR